MMDSFSDLVNAIDRLTLAGGGNPNHDPADGQFASGGGSSGGGQSKGTTATISINDWKKGKKPIAWHELPEGAVKIGSKFDVTGQDGEKVMTLSVTSTDPYRRFHKAKIVYLNPFPKNKDLSSYFSDREHGGEISLVNADLAHLRPYQK